MHPRLCYVWLVIVAKPLYTSYMNTISPNHLTNELINVFHMPYIHYFNLSYDAISNIIILAGGINRKWCHSKVLSINTFIPSLHVITILKFRWIKRAKTFTIITNTANAFHPLICICSWNVNQQAEEVLLRSKVLNSELRVCDIPKNR